MHARPYTLKHNIVVARAGGWDHPSDGDIPANEEHSERLEEASD